MGCSSCRSGSAKGTVWQVRLPSGQVRRYVTEGEAKAAAKKVGGTVQVISR